MSEPGPCDTVVQQTQSCVTFNQRNTCMGTVDLTAFTDRQLAVEGQSGPADVTCRRCKLQDFRKRLQEQSKVVRLWSNVHHVQ